MMCINLSLIGFGSRTDEDNRLNDGEERELTERNSNKPKMYALFILRL